jgi:D-alanyl-D-alanine dipeptidase
MFGDLDELRQRPIPSLESSRAMKQGYRDWPIEDSGELFAEPLERAEDFGLAGQNYYAGERNPPYWARADGAIDALLLRASVGALLKDVNGRLNPVGLKLYLFDAWRPRAVQAYFHDVWMPGEVRRRRPDLSEDDVRIEVQRYWAAPTDDPARPAPHATGGAVDLTIVWDDGAPLWMGSLFDDATALAGTDRFERDTDEFSFSHDEARANRRLLYWLMIEAGFSNHPDEWWHYSYGDQMWAIHMGRPAALYGLAEPRAELLV